MSRRHRLGIALALAGLAPWAACEQTLVTGKVVNTRNAPAADGSCPVGLGVCGKGAFAQCLDLQNDPNHCGTCDHACVAGIACAKGSCQQVACSSPVSVASQPISVFAPTEPFCGHGLMADVNGDGHPDLVNYGCQSNTFQVALGTAGGGFGTAATYDTVNASGATGLAIRAADSNGDGCDDLYVGCAQLWLGHPDGRLTRSPHRGDAQCYDPGAVADFNGDGIPDMVALTPSGGGFPGVFFADANGAFHQAASLPVQHNATAFVVRDWNQDGFPDLVNTARVLSVFLNRGDGTFEDEMNCAVFTSDWAQVVVEDFDHDGHWDVAAGMSDSGVGVLMGMGGCQFEPMVEYPLSSHVAALVHGDLDGDGVGDLVARTEDGGVYLLRGGGKGSFQSSLLSSVGPCREDCSVFLGDVTGDHKVDVVVSATWSTNVVGGQGTVKTSPAQILGNTCP